MNTENTAPVTETPVATVSTAKVGRPKAEIKYPRGIFTVDSLYELNRGPRGRGKRAKICKLTVRKHIEAQVAAGFLTQVENLKTGNPGQPAAQFIRTAVKAGLEAARAARAAREAGSTPTETPVVEVPLTETAPAPVAVEAPAPVAEPAPAVA